MEKQIEELINELNRDIKELEAELKAKSDKLMKLQLIVIQLEKILKGE